MKRTALALLVICAGLFSGCSANELENRCFPMLAVVDLAEGEGEALVGYTFPDSSDGEPEDESQNSEEDTEDGQAEAINSCLAAGEDFEEALYNYGLRLSREPDCNHLKVLVISKAFLENSEQMEAMLTYLKEEELYPRNAYVCVAEDVDALLALDGSLSDDLGSYLEDYLQNHQDEYEGGLVTLGQLLDEQANHLLDLKLPVLSVEGGAIICSSFQILSIRSKLNGNLPQDFTI